MNHAIALARQAASSDATILLAGEKRTGKAFWQNPFTAGVSGRRLPFSVFLVPPCRLSCWKVSCSDMSGERLRCHS